MNSVYIIKFYATLNQCIVLCKNVPQHDRDLMKKFGKVIGYFEGSHPVLWTTDTDLIKSIFVKDFDHFVNRYVYKDSFLWNPNHFSIRN